MKKSAIKRTLSCMLVLCFACQILLFTVSCGSSSSGTPETAVTSVTLNNSKDKVTVSATLSEEDAAQYKNATLCLFALEPFETDDRVERGAISPVAESRGAESMRFTVDYYFDHGMRSRLYQRFLLALRNENGAYSVLTEGVYLSNPEVLASGGETANPDTLKGVAVSVGEDTSVLTPSHTVVELPIEQYIYAAPVKGDAISYMHAGTTLSLCRSAVERLDEQINSLAAQGCAIYLRPVLTASPDSLGELSALGYAGAKDSDAYALNLENEDGYFWISGFFSFLAHRYQNVAGVIPGYSLNDSNYAGTSAASFESYMDGTLRLMRVAYNTFRSVNSSVRIYLPVDNLFTTDGRLDATEQGTREFLGAFASYAKKSGDFDWAVYISMDTPSGSETIYTESGTVNDGSVTEKYILPQTMSSLLELLATSELCYGSAQREMIWGISVTSEGDAENQRLSLLYTYAKALAHNRDKAGETAYVRAVVWETLSDTEETTAGLLKADGTFKPSGKLFSALGRADFASAVDLSTAQARLGARYNEISSVLSGGGETVRLYSGTAGGADTIPSDANATLLFGEGTLWGNAFNALPGTGVVSSYRMNYHQTPMLLATFENSRGCGVYTEALSGKQLKERNKLALTVTAALPEEQSSTELLVMMEATENGTKLHYTGKGTITDGVWSVMVFDIEAFSSGLSDETKVTLTLSLLSAEATEEEPVSLYLSRLESFDTRNWFMRGGWIWILVLVIVLLLVGAAIWIFRTYDIRWTPNTDRDKSGKNEPSAKKRLQKIGNAVLSKFQPRPRSRSRIMVKPDENASDISAHGNSLSERKSDEQDFDDEEDFDAEEADEIFDGSAAETRSDEDTGTKDGDR